MSRIEELMYKSGLTADGCWDQMDDYDRNAILNLAKYIVEECASLFQLTFTDEQYQRRIDKTIIKHFGIEDCE